MENRTGFRQRGHAYLAAQARAALGVSPEGQRLADLPLPVVHTALGAAVCALAVLIRPQMLGFERSAIASGSLAVLTAAVLLGYDRAIYAAERRPGTAAAALPVAAVVSFATILAAAPALPVRILAGVIAAVVIGVVPQLVARRAAGRESWLVRLLRDGAGVAVLAPVLVAGMSPLLPAASRTALVAGVAFLVSFDALAVGEALPQATALVTAVCVSSGLAAAAVGVHSSGAPTGTRAGALLLLWYALRGLAGSAVVAGPRRWLGIVEYAAFVVVAGGALGWIAANA